MPLLSICIPTFNRAEYIDQCLASIIRQVAEPSEVQIVVSDNASSDNTEAVVNKHKHTYTNILYIRNQQNIGADNNILQSMQLGSGKFVKLINDYLVLKENALETLLNLIRKFEQEKRLLFFANGNSPHRKITLSCSESLDGFLNYAGSFNATWIGAIGFWKEDLETVLGDYKFSTKHFFHAELFFECFTLRRANAVSNQALFDRVNMSTQAISYNFFEVFLGDFLGNLMENLRNSQKISSATFYRQKKIFFTHFIYPRYKKLKFKKHEFQVELKGVEKTIFKYYRTTPYFYLYAAYMPIYLLAFVIKKFFKGNKKLN